jgi:hypothetical protein
MNTSSSVRRAWWAIAARFLAHGLAVSTWVSRIPSVKSSLHLDDGVFGVCLFAAAVGSMIGIPVCGYTVTRFGSRHAVIWSTTGFCTALILPAFAWNAPSLFAALLVFGFMAGSNDVAINSQAVGVERLVGEPTMSRFHALFSIGGMGGAAIGGVVASRLVPVAWHFAIGAAAILLFAMSTGRFLIETAPDARQTLARPRLRTLPPALLFVSGIGFCILLSEGAIADWTAVYLKQVLGAGPGLAAAGYSVFSAAMSIFRLAGDFTTRKLGPAWTIRGGAALAAFGLATSIAASGPYWALPGFALTGAGFAAIIPLVFAAGGKIPGIGEGAGVATVTGLGYLAFLIGPPAIGFISQATSLRFGLAFVVILSGLAAVLVAGVEKHGLFAVKPGPESTPSLQ